MTTVVSYKWPVAISRSPSFTSGVYVCGCGVGTGRDNFLAVDFSESSNLFEVHPPKSLGPMCVS